MKPFLYSLDFVSLYQNIDPEHATFVLTDFMSRILDTNHLSIYAFKVLLTLLFENNVFKFKNNYYRQQKGLIMGCICGPTIANLYLYIMEQNWINIHKPLLYYRFIDDIFLVTEKELNFKQFEETFIYLKLTLNHGNTINFLDLNISFNSITNKLETSVYYKPTNNFSYLITSSDHPESIFKNIPKSLFIRLRRINSNFSDFVLACKEIINQLLKRGYKFRVLIKTFKIISDTERNTLIPYKEKNNIFKNDKKNILFFKKFNYNFTDCKKIIFNSFYKTFNNYEYMKNVNLLFINNVNNNLNNIFIHNIRNETRFKFSTSKCLETKCISCKFIHNKSFISIKNAKIPLLNFADCNTTHIVYIILCLKCNIFYIGETKFSLRKRFSQHLNNIRNFIPFTRYCNKVVATHFRRNNHKASEIKICVFKSNLIDDLTRKSVERDLIDILNNQKNNICINDFISKKIQKLAFI